MTASLAPLTRICPECRDRNDSSSGRCINCHCTLEPLPGESRHCHFCNGDVSLRQIFCGWCRKEQPTYW